MLQRPAGTVRQALQRVPGAGPAGFIVSGAEHVQEGLRSAKGGGLTSTTDQWRPAQSKVDRISGRRASGFGRATQRKIINNLTRTHGMTPEAAQQAYQRFYAAPAPSRAAQATGKARQNVQYVAQKTQPAVKAVKTTARVATAPARLGIRAVKKPLGLGGKMLRGAARLALRR